MRALTLRFHSLVLTLGVGLLASNALPFQEGQSPPVIGRVSANSRPLPDATISVYDERPAGWLHEGAWSLLRSPPEVLQQVNADEDLPPGLALKVQARSPFVKGSSAEFTVLPGRTLSDLQVVFQNATTVHVDVRGGDGLPLPFAWVTLHHPKLPAYVDRATVVTDLEGRSSFPGVLVGEVELKVAAMGHASQTRTLNLSSGKTHIERVILERKE